jgi:hypothetical protein
LPYILALSIDNLAQPNYLFDHLELPVLRAIFAKNIKKDESSPVGGLWLSQRPFLSLLSRSSHTLCKLVISDTHTQDIPDLGLVLQAAPLLIQLIVHKAPGWFSADVLNRLTRQKGSEGELVPRLKGLDIIEPYSSLPLQHFSDMIVSRWRADGDCRHSVERINVVRLQLYDPPGSEHQGYRPDPGVLKRLSDCRVKGMDIMVTYVSHHICGIRDLLDASGQSTGDM